MKLITRKLFTLELYEMKERTWDMATTNMT